MINWKKAVWDVRGMTTYNIEYEKICKPLEIGLILIPGFWSVYDSSRICKNLRGNMNVISNKENNDEIAEMMKNSEMCSIGENGLGGIWTGWWDEITRGQMDICSLLRTIKKRTTLLDVEGREYT